MNVRDVHRHLVIEFMRNLHQIAVRLIHVSQVVASALRYQRVPHSTHLDSDELAIVTEEWSDRMHSVQVLATHFENQMSQYRRHSLLRKLVSSAAESALL